ncbi:MAG: hypothetical protein HY804_05975 [Nitrospinae bacterium]|nr:hypothetical protein [Nitrospinota bacterium]
MLVIIKSAPESPEARRGLALARDLGADVALIQGGVYFLTQGGLEGVKGAIYALEPDILLRGAGAQRGGARMVGYDGLVDLMAGADKVLGMF